MEATRNQEYFERRAAEERAAADCCADERAALPHRELARRYDSLAKGEDKLEIEAAPETFAGLTPEFRILP
jgi:hypothetical protein